MICKTGGALRAAWYAESSRMNIGPVPSYEQLIRIAQERLSDGYQDALEALKEHNKNCEVCHVKGL